MFSVNYLESGIFVVVQSPSCIQLCNAMDCSISGLPVPHHLPEFAQVHVHWLSDAIQACSFSLCIGFVSWKPTQVKIEATGQGTVSLSFWKKSSRSRSHPQGWMSDTTQPAPGWPPGLAGSRHEPADTAVTGSADAKEWSGVTSAHPHLFIQLTLELAPAFFLDSQAAGTQGKWVCARVFGNCVSNMRL